MKFFKWFREKPVDLDLLLNKAKSGDTEARERLIESCRKFIEKTVALQTHNSLDVTSRDEYSIALMAFNEAIDKFDPCRNRAFLSFAGDVMKMRMIDYYRRNKAEAACTPLSSFEYSEELSFNCSRTGSIDPVGERVEQEHDMNDFLSTLKEYGIGLDDLVKNTPRHHDSRLLSIRIARIISGDPELLGDLRKKRAIPLKKLLGKIQVNPKTVERHRKYIIAICLVLSGNMETLKSYIEQTEKGGGGGDL